MHHEDEGLNLGTSAHLFVMSSLQKAKDDGGKICRNLVLAGVVVSLTGGISLKKRVGSSECQQFNLININCFTATTTDSRLIMLYCMDPLSD